MNDFVLDTDTCIYWLNGEVKVRRKVEEIGLSNLRLTIVSLAELRYGAYNSRNISENLANIRNFTRIVTVLPLNHDAADRFGSIKADLRTKGQIINDFDILIAAITLHHGGVLVTNNTEHFQRIASLNYQNWLVE